VKFYDVPRNIVAYIECDGWVRGDGVNLAIKFGWNITLHHDRPINDYPPLFQNVHQKKPYRSNIAAAPPRDDPSVLRVDMYPPGM
jgi:hypothetical protein